ncbi:MAG: Hsp20/alpha crystallin family protein [Pseudomonadaceae bacterium]|nr:Hsp20/alpha crystallin family protein [Pseudomonadaceae bacterium]
MTLVRWNPRREFDDIFSRFGDAASEGLRRTEWLPPVDISENEEGFGIEVEVPGFSREDVKVAVHEGVLTVSGERSVSDDDRKRHRIERAAGEFSRSFRLPDNVDETSIKATAKDGVLYVALPKQAEAKPRSIEVEVH